MAGKRSQTGFLPASDYRAPGRRANSTLIQSFTTSASGFIHFQKRGLLAYNNFQQITAQTVKRIS